MNTAFGPWSTLLALGVGFGLTVGLLLAFTRCNRTANGLLALLLLAFAMKLMPYALGFAGYYDAYPWLSFAPFELGLAIGPLLYLHVRRLTADRLPRGWAWHLLPAALQFAYRAVVFVQPLTFKNAWNDRIHRDWIDPAETFLGLLSFAIYLWLALRAYRGYQRWLDAHLSNREEFRIVWVRNVLAAFAIALPVWAVYEALSYGIGFDYFQRFPLYVCFTLLVFYLGLEGWRHAGTRYPLPAPPEAAPETMPARAEPAARDWAAQGRDWLARTEAAGWWRDPDLSLERLARHLGTNTAYLSRALNDGLGLSFNDAINRLRVDEVCRRLRSEDDGDLLQIALDAGFSAKSSFNRWFKARTGTTPSRYRTAAVDAGAKT
jgi:AraC-like DNA-binding protein